LALACGTYQAHISLIESDRIRPQFSTLLRICEALELSQEERAQLLALAGYQVTPGLPDRRSIQRVLSKLVPILDGCGYPADVLDDSERLYYWNPMAAAIWAPLQGVPDPNTFETAVRGKRVVELYLNEARFPKWTSYLEDADAAIARSVFFFARAFRARPHEPDLQRTLNRVQQNRNFAKYLEAVESGAVEIFPEHTTYRILHPVLGKLHLHAWRTHTAIDQRFVITHFLPVDSATGTALRHIAQQCRDRSRKTEQNA